MTARRRRRTAVDRLRQFAPAGPPFFGLMLDAPTVDALRRGIVAPAARAAAAHAMRRHAVETNQYAAFERLERAQRRGAK